MINQLEAVFNHHFPSQTVSAITAAFAAENLLLDNPSCQSAVAATLDAVDHVLTVCAALERYIHLAVPKVEDGGNFGVSIQLAAIKVITDQVEKLEKGSEELFKYASTRADALEKCKLASTTQTKSATTTVSESAGNEPDKETKINKETKSNSTTRSTEEKSVDTVSSMVESALRKQAVVAVDVRFFSKAKSTMTATILALLAVVDFMDKNKVKIAAPKGDSGSRSYHGSMY
jgi:Proteasome activator pa28 beta subunit